MDPYHVLGIDYNATREEIKQAYRRLAMKWHPDRNQDSHEARDRFHEAAEAYKSLFERESKKTNGDAGARNRDERRSRYASDTGPEPGAGGNGNDESAESVFWDVMLDYAIKLAQTGMSEHEIATDICRNGCSETLANRIADKAYNIHAHYSRNGNAGKRRKAKPDQTTFREERLDDGLWRAFLGQRNFVLSPRGSTDDYLVVFRAFRRATGRSPLSWISPNKRLMRIFNFSLVLFAVLLLAIYYYPGPSPYKLLPDKMLLQLPFLSLPLMFVWMLYRKLWSLSLLLAPVCIATIAYYNTAVPEAVHRDLYALIPVALAGFAPFALVALFGNFLYYRRALGMIRQARALFDDNIDQMVWIKNRAGTSATAAILFLLIFTAALIHLLPRNWDYDAPIAVTGNSIDRAYEAEKLARIERQISAARRHFDIAESRFSATPPDYAGAASAYGAAADNGSLLAAYKLGYMYYTGEGVRRDDARAFDAFDRATRAPLAFQPHKLELTTRFLGESYNNLGIMYQSGLGTRKNIGRAADMYRRAAEFGVAGARRSLERVHRPVDGEGRRSLAYPDYQ